MDFGNVFSLAKRKAKNEWRKQERTEIHTTIPHQFIISSCMVGILCGAGFFLACHFFLLPWATNR